jgi:HEAT repeat protein
MTRRPADELEIIAALATYRRRKVLPLLEAVGTDRSIEILRASLGSRDPLVQIGAVDALADIATPRAAELLMECLEREVGQRFTFAANHLAKNHGRQAMPAFLKVLDERSGELDTPNKCILIKGLATTPHRKQVPVLAAMARDRSRTTRRRASEALALIRAPEAREALEEIAASESWARSIQSKRALRWIDRYRDLWIAANRWRH